LVTALASLTTALPNEAGSDEIGFCVVNRDGDVLFHSVPALSQSHNLLVETNYDPTLEAMLRQERGQDPEQPAGITTRGHIPVLSYFGIDRRAFVRTATLGGYAPLFIVTYENSDVLRRLVLKGIMVALGETTVYASVAFVLLWLGLLVRERRTAYFWPDNAQTSTYFGLGLWYLALTIVSTFLLHGKSGWSPCGVSAVAAASTLAAFPLSNAVRERVRAAPLEEPPSVSVPAGSHPRGAKHWSSYGFAAVVFFLVCVALPPIGFASSSLQESAAEFATRREASSRLAVEKLELAARWHSKHLQTKAVVVALGLLPPEGGVQQFEKSKASFARRLQDSVTLHARDFFLLGSPWTIAWLVALIATFLLVRWCVNNLFLWGLDALPRESLDDLHEAKGNVWYVVTSRRTLDAVKHRCEQHPGKHVVVLDPRAPELVGSITSLLDAQHPCIIVSYQGPIQVLHTLRDAKPAGDLFERFASRLTTVAVVHVADARPHDDELSDYVASLFQSSHPAARSKRQPRPLSSGASWVRKELKRSLCLFEAAKRTLKPGALVDLDNAELRRRIRDATWPYYVELWNSCSELEQLTLVQIAEETVINAKRRDVVHQLLARGLLVRRPMLTTMNDSFAAALHIVGAEVGARAWEHPATAGLTWDHLRLPLATLALCTGYILFFTDRSMIDNTVLYATTVTGLLPQLGHMLSLATTHGKIAAPIAAAASSKV
jgi:hypothetical protein